MLSFRVTIFFQELNMPMDPEVALTCVHLYSLLGDRRKSRFYDRLFVHLLRRSISSAPLDSRDNLE
ncbi:MAG: hypothetical protein A3F83_11980 [Candidatus Glassbacteria bacterium RIFCSPLOWO2_12_FULL_58_11]|uniref:Uncharacterized protein n=1 Tax=Candidatus Glassbacteria bacterium RIFCSPLOWO2_12_FULL_58_11 TaxID=1817867 RepID=A0A1F5YM16_9BACT|nr:MAG: hypothetical protein A3F83_11980 [Candidatus Glassbacteria bacterium RIFCSPLOWO2_12_FULL_58_11]